MNFLTDSTYKQIKSLEEQGRVSEAANVAQRAFADTLTSRAGEMERNLGTVERGWLRVKDAAKGAWDAILNVGRADTVGDRLSVARATLEQKLNTPLTVDNAAMRGSREKAIAALRQEISLLSEQERMTRRGAEAEAQRAEQMKAQVSFDKAGEKFLTDKVRMERELAAARVQGAAAGRTQAEVEKRLGEIRASYAKKGGSSVATENKDLRDQQRIFAELADVSSTYYSELAAAQEQRAKGNIGEAQYIAYVNDLIQKQPFAVALAKDEAAANVALSKAYAEAAAERIKTIQSMERAADGLQSQNDALREEIELIGLSAAQQTQVLQQRNEAIILTKEATLAELERQSAVTGTQTRVEIALAAEIAALKERNALLGAKGVKNAAVDAAKTAADEWQKTTDSINQTLTDSLMRGFESGKDFAKNLRDTVVNMFKTMVLRPVISAVLSPISGALTGAMGLSGAAQAGQGMSAIGAAGNLFSAGSALGGLGAVGGALSGFTTAATASIQSLVGMSGTVAQMTTSLAAAGHTAASGVTAGVKAFQAIPGWGWAIAGIAALAAIFSKKATPHAGGASTYSEAGGLVSSADIYRSSGLADTRAYNAEISTALTGNVAKAIGDTLNATAKAFGKTAGYEISTAFADDTSKDGAWGSLMIRRGGESVIDWRDTQTSAWAPKEFADGEAGSKEYLAAIAKSARDALVGAIGDVDWATDMLTALGESPTLEGLAQTVQQINAAKSAFVGFGQYMPAFASLADSAVSKIVQASGGVDALAGNMSVFVDGFYTDAEKLAINTENVRAAMERLGFEMPTTRDEYKALVQAQIALGDAGATTTAGLLGVAGAFAAVVPAAEQASQAVANMVANAMQRIASTRFDWQNKLLEQGGQGALAQQRTDARDLADLTAGLPPEMAAQVAAEFAANLALREQYESNERAIEAWRQGLAAAERDMQAAAEADRTAAQAALDAASGRARAAQRDLDTLQGVFDLLGDAIGTLRGQVTATAQMQAQQARDYIKQATLLIGSGTVPDQGKLQAAIRSASGGIDATVFANQAEEDYARLVLAGELAALQGGTAGQLTIAEQHLSLAQQGVTIAQQQLDALGVIASAISSLGGAQAAATGAKKEQWSNVAGNMVWASGGGAVGVKSGDDVDIYGKDGSRFLGSEAIAYVRNQVAANDEKSVYAAAVSSGISAKSLDALMGWPEGTSNDWAELNKLPKFAVGTNYVPRDMVARIHEGEAIVPKAYNPAAGGMGGQSNARLESLVQALTAEVAELKGLQRDSNRNTRRTAEAVNGNPDAPMLVETV